VEVEEILGSKGRIKILKILFRDGYANITRIVRETGLHHRLVVKHLEDLKRMGIVEERRYGRMRIYYVNLSDPRVSALREALRALGLL
jgi:DNA-binding transcriptional ArsR family regulator